MDNYTVQVIRLDEKFNPGINLILLLFNFVNLSYRDFSRQDVSLKLIFIKRKI